MRPFLRSIQPEPEEQACLDGFQALSDQLRRAILAIAADDSVSLAEAVGSQAERAASLQAALVCFERAGAPSKTAKTRMLRSAKELAALNEEFAALTAHSADWLRCMAALHGRAQTDREGQSWQA